MKKMAASIVFVLVFIMLVVCMGCKKATEKTIEVDTNQREEYLPKMYLIEVGEHFDIALNGNDVLLVTERGGFYLDQYYAAAEEKTFAQDPVCLDGKADIYTSISENGTELSVCDSSGELYRIPMGMDTFGQLLKQGEVIWYCDGNRLFRNEMQIEMPQAGNGRWQAAALVNTDHGLFVLLRKLVGEGENAENLFIPLLEETKAIRAQDGAQLPEQLCGALPLCMPESGCVYAGGSVWRTDGKSFFLLADLQKCGVNPAKLRRVLVLEDGRILCLQQDCLIVLSAKPAGSTQQADGTQASSEAQVSEPPAERVTLRLGTLYSAFEFSDMISYVNLHSAACSLEVKEYKSMDQLNRALLSGEVDILGLPDLSALKNYAAKGLLTPMETVAPTLFSSGVLYENMVEALRVDGSCCCLPLVLQPQVNAVPKRYQAAASDLAAPQAYFSFLAENEPEAFGLDTREIRFSNWLTATADYWIDAEAGTTHFQTEEFLALLEYCDRFVLTPAEAMANQGAAEGTPMASCNQPMYLGMHLWEDYDLVPPPFAGVSACTLHSNTYLAVVSGCDLEAAKALMMTLFTDEGWHETWKSSEMTRLCISTNREWTEDDLDAEVAQMLDDPYTEIPDEEGFLSGVAQMKALYAEANHFAGGISELNNVILEEAQVYFNGDCTAQQAAERIENRVWLYINEHN